MTDRKRKASDAYGQRPTGLSKLIALQKYMAPLTGYFDRQERIARGGLAIADQGARQVRQGDLTGIAGMVQGPMQWAGSYPAALFPVDEAYTQLPQEVSPFVAGGLELMALGTPGPKGPKGLKPGLTAADDAAEIAKIRARMRIFENMPEVPKKKTLTPGQLAELKRIQDATPPSKYEIPPMEEFLPKDRKKQK